MLEHIIFLFYIYLFLFSIIGYGLIFSKVFCKDLSFLDFGCQGIIGFYTLYTISLLTTFFFAHNYIFNSLIHLIGIISFLFFFNRNKISFTKQSKNILILSLILIVGIYVFKNHDDFPYYHLTYSLNLSNNPFIAGTGVFSHGFKTSSSLFYFHSLLYMPLIDFYLFHAGPFFIMIYFNFHVLSKLRSKYLNNEIDFIYFFSLLNLIFVNIVFYRLGEHGTDRSAQILLFIIFITFFELLLNKKDSFEKNKLVNFLLVGIFLAASMKALFYIYLILVPIILFRKSFFGSYVKNIKNYKLLAFLILSFSFTIGTNFLSTGCLLYPAEKTCLGNFDWSVPKNQVKEMKTHYEWWAKAGGGPGFKVDMSKEEYVKDFNWVKGWIDRHFFNKVSDTLLGIIAISVLVILLFKDKKIRKFRMKDFILVYLILLFFLTEWFLNHPSMRYGGFVLISLPIFILSSQLLETFNVSNRKKILVVSIFFISLTFLIYNGRNFVRLNKEINFYNYNIVQSPFFYTKNVESKIIYEDDKFKIYTPIKNMCWSSLTPCSYAKNLQVTNFLHIKVVQNKKIEP